MSLQQDGNVQHLSRWICARAARRGSPRRRRSIPAPSYSPDGARIVFESRSRRHAAALCHECRRLATSSASRFGEGTLFDAGLVAARRPHRLHQAERAASSRIGVMKPDGSGERILTEGFHNEGPTWAPNGRVLMFFRDPGGNGGPAALFDRSHRLQRAAGSDAGLRVGSGLVAAAQVNGAALIWPFWRRMYPFIHC